MRTFRIRIGLLSALLQMGLALALALVHIAPVSAQMTGQNNFPNYFEESNGTSPSFALQGGSTWLDGGPMESNSFKLAAETATSSSAASSAGTGGAGTSSANANNGQATTGGGRGNTAKTPPPVARSAGNVRRITSRPAKSSSKSRSSVPAISSKSVSRLRSSSASSAKRAPRFHQLRPSKPHNSLRPAPSKLGALLESSDSTLHASAGQAFSAFTAGLLSLASWNGLFLIVFIAIVIETILSGVGWLKADQPSVMKRNGSSRPVAGRHSKKPSQKRNQKPVKPRGKHGRIVAFIVAATLTSFMHLQSVQAEQTVPALRIYNGRLSNAAGQPITTEHNIRFSYWNSADFVSTDLTADGAINTSATNFVLWQEVHSVTPDSNGYFSVTLGSITTLPDMMDMETSTLLSLYLQVEVKAAASANTAYELLDPKPSDSAIDRSQIVSVPFARNADLLDQHDVGTGSGSIPVLGSGGTLWKAAIPGGTNGDFFTIDADDSAASSIALRFGETLGKTLTYDIDASRFVFNDSLEVQGDLTVTGLVNGVDITNLQSSTGALKVASGGGLHIQVFQGSYRLAGTTTDFAGSGSVSVPASTTSYVFFGSGGLTVNTAGFPTDESYIPLAEVVTNAGAVTRVLDRRAMQSDDREQVAVQTFNPEFEKASYQADGADNVGQLTISHDNISLKNFYLWTSTRPTLQDYDIILRVPLPEDFVRWQTDGGNYAVTVGYRSTSADTANNKLDIQLYDTNGVPVTLSGTATNLAGTSWATTQLNFSGSPTWTAGQDFLLKLHVSAKDNYQMQIGSVTFRMVRLAR